MSFIKCRTWGKECNLTKTIIRQSNDNYHFLSLLIMMQIWCNRWYTKRLCNSKCRNNDVIDLIHKSQNAPVPYPTMLLSDKNVQISVLNGALWDMEQVHSWIYEVGQLHYAFHCPACRTTLVATRFRVAVICPIIQVPHCIRVFFYFVWFVFINHIFQFYNELCTYCNILDIYLS